MAAKRASRKTTRRVSASTPVSRAARAPEPVLPTFPLSALNELALASAEKLVALKEGWAAVMTDARHDNRLTTKNQLYGWRPYLVFHFEGDEETASPLPSGITDDCCSGDRA